MELMVQPACDARGMVEDRGNPATCRRGRAVSRIWRKAGLVFAPMHS